MKRDIDLSKINSKTACDLVAKLLIRNPDHRLADPAEIKKHPFYKKIDWEKVKNKKVDPPFKLEVGFVVIPECAEIR